MKHLRTILFCLLLIPGFTTVAQETGHPFKDEIGKFREEDRADPPPSNAILFIGSSSFRMWRDVADYFPGFTIINRGFGGSTLSDQILYVGDIVFPYSPRQIVVYCGENDLAYSDGITSGEVCARFMKWFQLVREKLPDVRITWVSIKPSPCRWNLEEKFRETNDKIKAFLLSQPGTDFVDIWNSMLDGNKQPDTALFLPDRLHMNEKGYRVWQKAIKPVLIN